MLASTTKRLVILYVLRLQWMLFLASRTVRLYRSVNVDVWQCVGGPSLCHTVRPHLHSETVCNYIFTAWLHLHRVTTPSQCHTVWSQCHTVYGHTFTASHCMATHSQCHTVWPHIHSVTLCGHTFTVPHYVATPSQCHTMWPHIHSVTLYGHTFTVWLTHCNTHVWMITSY